MRKTIMTWKFVEVKVQKNNNKIIKLLTLNYNHSSIVTQNFNKYVTFALFDC